MGFFKSTLEANASFNSYILPRITSISNIEHIECSLWRESNSLNSGERNAGRIGQMEDIGYDSIPYVVGENIKLINWKIVAQKNEYWMREREKARSTQVKYHFILSPIYYEAYTSHKERSKWITSYISIVAYYLTKYQEVKVSYYKKGRWKSSYIRDLKGLDEVCKKLADYYQDKGLEPISLNLLPIEKGNLERRIIICYLPEKEWLQEDKGHSISGQYMICTGPLKEIVDEEMIESTLDKERIGYITDEYCFVKSLG